MKTTLFRICAMLGIGMASSITTTTLQAEEHTLVGLWNVSVTVTDCTTNKPIRTVHSLQAYHRDRTVAETANTASRGPSEGVWRSAGDGQTYEDSFYFYRYTSLGTFASLAHGVDTISLSADGSQYTSVGHVYDFDAQGNLLSIGCVTHAAYRLDGSEQH